MDEDLRLDNNGLVGNYTWTYDAGIAAGKYNLTLEITDVQGHVVVFRHVGIEFLEYGMFLSLPVGPCPDTMLIAPGQTSTVEFMVEHTGSVGIQMDVEFDLYTHHFLHLGPTQFGTNLLDTIGVEAALSQ